MKNPMIENNISADLFEAIDENAVNGGAVSTIKFSIAACPNITQVLTQIITSAVTPSVSSAISVATVVINKK